MSVTDTMEVFNSDDFSAVPIHESDEASDLDGGSFLNGMSFSVLFVPFDAAVQHYERNAKNGVKAKFCPHSLPDKEEVTVECGGKPMLKKDINDKIPAIIQILCNEIKTSCPRLNLSEDQQKLVEVWDENHESQPPPRKLEQRLNDPIKNYPHLLFLSERPKDVTFPNSIKLESGVSYQKLGKAATAKRGVQEIHAYARQDLHDSNDSRWRCESMVKTAACNQEEHVLKISYENNGITCTTMGVHLTSNNTSANRNKLSDEIASLKSFCNHHQIDLAIGDFNMRMEEPASGVGARFRSTVHVKNKKNETYPISSVGFLRPDNPQNVQDPQDVQDPQKRKLQKWNSAHEVYYLDQYTNSSNDRHYMGYYIANTEHVRLDGTDLIGLHGLSLSRSIESVDSASGQSSGREYFSDHAPIYVEMYKRPAALKLELTPKCQASNNEEFADQVDALILALRGCLGVTTQTRPVPGERGGVKQILIVVRPAAISDAVAAFKAWLDRDTRHQIAVKIPAQGEALEKKTTANAEDVKKLERVLAAAMRELYREDLSGEDLSDVNSERSAMDED